jgi:transposase
MVDVWREGRTRRGKPPSWEIYWKKEFKVERKCDGEGVDWFLHQFRVLRPHFIPVIKHIKAKYAHGGDVYVVEDGAAAHRAKANYLFWVHVIHLFREEWPPHSPDLNPIKKIWSWIKQRIPFTTDHDTLEKYWHQAWNDLPQEVIQHCIERMEWVVQKVIDMKGNNKYDEKRPKKLSKETSEKYGSKR